MFANTVKIMLYVKDVPESSAFWQRIGFVEKERNELDGTLVVELAPNEHSDTRLVLYDLGFIQQHSPEVVGNTPSLLFTVEDITTLYKTMLAENIQVGELIQLPTGLVFNFVDNEDNYFAVSELSS